jgi:hypothetical protein
VSICARAAAVCRDGGAGAGRGLPGVQREVVRAVPQVARVRGRVPAQERGLHRRQVQGLPPPVLLLRQAVLAASD